jgi:hypothetical protein
MESGKRLEFYRELYMQEAERQSFLGEGVNVIVTVTTILGGGVVFLTGSAPLPTPGPWRTVFQVALWTGVSLLAAALALLIAAWMGFRYRPLPDPKQLEAWWREIEQYDLLFPPDEYDRGGIPEAGTRFERALIEHYVEAAHFNQRANVRTGSLANWSRVALSSAALALAVAMIPRYLYHDATNAPGGIHAPEKNPAASTPASAHAGGSLRLDQAEADPASGLERDRHEHRQA